MAYFNEKILRISLKLNFTANTLGCYGLFFVFEDAVAVRRYPESLIGHLPVLSVQKVLSSSGRATQRISP